jgi:hypothetical protein
MTCEARLSYLEVVVVADSQSLRIFSIISVT